MTDPRLAVIVLAAGQGTRMRSSRPKVLHPLAGVPIVGHVLATARELSAAHVVAVVRHEREAVAAMIGELMPEAIVVDQDEIPGTGRAVELAVAALPDDFDGEVVVVSGDVPLLDAATLSELLAEHRATRAAATVLSAIVDDPTGYGRIVRDPDGGVDRIVEQKDATDDELPHQRDQLRHLRLRGHRAAHASCRGSAPTTPRASATSRMSSACCARRPSRSRRSPRHPGSSPASTTGCSSRMPRRVSTR